jgi:ATPase family AAA domain-containing protein 3A/B
MALRAVASGARSSLLLGFSGAALGTTVAACADDTAKMFDPEALERGAKALREIQASPYAKKVFEQIKAQEATKQQELRAKEAEFKAQAEQAAIVSPAAEPACPRLARCCCSDAGMPEFGRWF